METGRAARGLTCRARVAKPERRGRRSRGPASERCCLEELVKKEMDRTTAYFAKIGFVLHPILESRFRGRIASFMGS